ncbi:MAG: glycosyltransferase family 9 protein [Elusimicrobiaceae bacterium]|nr:glycosyltransferase family 9 protein [Elusimicrobiaceae bacterium]
MRAPGKILVIQLRRIGDNLLTLPAISALKRAFPGARVDFLAEPPADILFKNSPDINELLVYDHKKQFFWLREIRRRRYDWVIDYLGNPRSIALAAASGARVRAGAKDVFWSFLYNVEMKRGAEPAYAPLEKILMLAPFGVKPDRERLLPVLRPDLHAVKAADVFLAANGLAGTPVLGAAPVSRRITRQYPPELFAETLKLVYQATGIKSVVLWGPGELEIARKITDMADGCAILSPETKNLASLTGLVSRFSALLANCNGPKHIAVATGVSTLTIHASSDPRNWTPPSPATGAPERSVSEYYGPLPHTPPAHIYISNPRPACLYCRRNDCDSLACLKNLPPQAVAAKTAELLKLVAGKQNNTAF